MLARVASASLIPLPIETRVISPSSGPRWDRVCGPAAPGRCRKKETTRRRSVTSPPRAHGHGHGHRVRLRTSTRQIQASITSQHPRSRQHWEDSTRN